MLRTNTKPDREWVDQGAEFERELAKFCKSKDIKIYSTRSETEAAVVALLIATRSKTFFLLQYLLLHGGEHNLLLDGGKR